MAQLRVSFSLGELSIVPIEFVSEKVPKVKWKGGFSIWKQAFEFHFLHGKDIFLLFPFLFVPVLGDVLHSLLIYEVNQKRPIDQLKILRRGIMLTPALFELKIYFFAAAFLWGFVPIYGIIQDLKYRQYWAMASNVLVFEKLTGAAARERCRQLILFFPAGSGVRTLVTVPTFFFLVLTIAWMIGGEVHKTFYFSGLLLLIAAFYWLTVPISGAVNSLLYLCVWTNEKNSSSRLN